MRTLHLGLRVSDLDRSLTFYTALGYQVVGAVPDSPIGHLVMLKLPGDDVVAVELVHDPGPGADGSGRQLSHLVVQVDSMETTLAALEARGITTEEPRSPDGSGDLWT